MRAPGGRPKPELTEMETEIDAAKTILLICNGSGAENRAANPVPEKPLETVQESMASVERGA